MFCIIGLDRADTIRYGLVGMDIGIVDMMNGIILVSTDVLIDRLAGFFIY